MNMERLVEHLVAIGALKTEKYIHIFRQLDRKLFMWPGYEDEAYRDSPSLLGETGQTISAPHMHAYYLEYSGVSEDDIVLEVGVGSGYLSALVGLLIKTYGGQGHVYGLEYDPRLYVFAKTNIARAELEDYVTIIGRMIIPIGHTFYQELRIYIKIGGKTEYKPLFPVSFVKMKGYEGGSF